MSRNEFSCDCNVIHQEAVDEVLQRMPNEDIFNKLADLFKLIGDTTRCRILFAHFPYGSGCIITDHIMYSGAHTDLD